MSHIKDDHELLSHHLWCTFSEAITRSVFWWSFNDSQRSGISRPGYSVKSILHFDYPRGETNFNNHFGASTQCTGYESALGSLKDDLKEMDREKLKLKAPYKVPERFRVQGLISLCFHTSFQNILAWSVFRKRENVALGFSKTNHEECLKCKGLLFPTLSFIQNCNFFCFVTLS